MISDQRAARSDQRTACSVQRAACSVLHHSVDCLMVVVEGVCDGD